MRYGFIHQERKAYALSRLCWIMKVSRSGYYTWKKRQGRSPSASRCRLLERVKRLHEETRGSYGSRRVSRQLRQEGFEVGRSQARGLMRDAGLKVAIRRSRPQTTDSRHGSPIAPNRLERQFNPTQANRVWAGDVSVPQQAA